MTFDFLGDSSGSEDDGNGQDEEKEPSGEDSKGSKGLTTESKTSTDLNDINFFKPPSV